MSDHSPSVSSIENEKIQQCLDHHCSEEIQCVVYPKDETDIDAEGYHLANRDVADAGIDALDHYRSNGKNEIRFQWVARDEVKQLRTRKLKNVQFKREPLNSLEEEVSLRFVSTETLESFEISETPPISSNQYSEELVEEFRSNPDKLFLDVGAGLRPSVFGNVVNTEVYPSISTDVVCLGEDLPFADNQFDKVICFAVLEHTKRPWDVAREICRVLKPGGQVVIDYPFLQPVHGYPHHFFNATPKGNESLFEEFCEIESVEIRDEQSPIFALYWMINEWNNGLDDSFKPAFQDMTIRQFLQKYPAQQLDQFYCKELSPEAKRIIPCGSTLTARKRSN